MHRHFPILYIFCSFAILYQVIRILNILKKNALHILQTIKDDQVFDPSEYEHSRKKSDLSRLNCLQFAEIASLFKIIPNTYEKEIEWVYRVPHL